MQRQQCRGSLFRISVPQGQGAGGRSNGYAKHHDMDCETMFLTF